MSEFKRRKFLQSTAAVTAGAAVGPFIWVKNANAQWSNTPEKGAKLRVLRWSRFVQGDIDRYMVNVKAFQDKYGIEVRVDSEGWEDVRPKAAVAANTGAGPDIILVDQRRCESLSGEARRRHRRLQLPRRQVRRLVSGVRSVSATRRQEMDRRAARGGRRWHGLPRKRHQSGRIRQLPEGHRRLPQAVQGAEGKGHARGYGAGQCDRRWQYVVPMARLGFRRQARRQGEQGRDRQPRDAQGPRVREGALRHVRAGNAVMARPEQQQGVPRRAAVRARTTASRSITRRRTRPIPRSRKWRRTSTTPTCRSAPSGIRPSSSCSSTR